MIYINIILNFFNPISYIVPGYCIDHMIYNMIPLQYTPCAHAYYNGMIIIILFVLIMMLVVLGVVMLVMVVLVMMVVMMMVVMVVVAVIF